MKIPFLTKKQEVALDLKDKDGKRVVWYKESYEIHIKMRHIDVKNCQDKVKKAIASPQLKAIDRRRKATHYYYEIRKDKKSRPLYLKVVVDYNHSPAFIRTAHMTTDVSDARVVY